MTAQVVFTRQAQRRDTAANWTAVNPVLLSGEWGLETDTRKLKIGDGVTAWNALAYNGSTPGGPGDPTNLSIVNRTAAGLTIASSTGGDADLPLATDQLAGLQAPSNRAKAEGAVQAVALTPPNGWSTSSANIAGSVTLTLDLPSGFSLPSNSSQTNWDTAYSMRGQWSGGATGLNAATGTYEFGFSTTDSGTTITIFDLNRPLLGSAESAVGYSTGTGGVITQATDKSTGVSSSSISSNPNSFLASLRSMIPAVNNAW